MKKNNLDAFKAKANAILVSDALQNVTGGVNITDAEYCHTDATNSHGQGKLQQGYAPHQIDIFFSNPEWTRNFDNMFDPTNPESPDMRDAYFSSIVSQF